MALCILCGRKISRGKVIGHLTNSSMVHHMKTHHSSVLIPGVTGKGATRGTLSTESKSRGTDESRKAPSDSPPVPAMQQQQQCQATGEEAEWGGRHPEAIRITRCIGEMIALDDLPFSVVEEVGFRRLLQVASPKYRMPSVATLSRNVVPSLYQACRQRVKEQLARAEGHPVHFTSDIWSSPSSPHAYLSVTAHWWQPQEGRAVGSRTGTGGYKWALLHAQVMDQNHTFASILQAINRMAEAWLNTGAMADVTRGFMVTDDSSGMTKAVNEGRFVGIHCVAHKLHLTVRDALGLEGKGAPSALRDLIDASRKIAEHFIQSAKGSQLLWEKQAEVGVPQRCLLTDVSTTRNSTYLMLERLVEQQKALHEVARHGEIGVQALLLQWDTLEQVVHILKPFKDATETLSAATATLSQVIPIIKLLGQKMAAFLNGHGLGSERATLGPEVVSLVQRLQWQIEERLEPLTQSDDYMLATMCDPRVKGSVALHSASFSHWKNELVERVRKSQRQRDMREENGDPASAPSGAPNSSDWSNPGQAIWAQAVGAAVGSRGAAQPWALDNAETTVMRYLAEPIEDPSTDPLAYWVQKGQVWQDLARVAQELLSCPPTCVPSERMFSVMGDIPSPHRSNLPPELVEQLVFLKVNLPLLGFPDLPCETEFSASPAAVTASPPTCPMPGLPS